MTIIMLMSFFSAFLVKKVLKPHLSVKNGQSVPPFQPIILTI